MTGRGHFGFGILTGISAGILFDSIPLTLLGVSISTISALVPDLDSPNGTLIKRLLGKNESIIKQTMLIAGLFFISWGVFLPSILEKIVLILYGSIILFLSLTSKEGTMRKVALMSISIGFFFLALYLDIWWMFILAAYIGIVPHMPHRGPTHTIWALLIWGIICFGMEYTLKSPGLMWMGTLGYFSHLLGDTLTLAGVKWFAPLSSKTIGIPLIKVGTKEGYHIEYVLMMIFIGITSVLYIFLN